MTEGQIGTAIYYSALSVSYGTSEAYSRSLVFACHVIGAGLQTLAQGLKKEREEQKESSIYKENTENKDF